jgi:Polyketide cyclase / dehydrase and lipid transport
VSDAVDFSNPLVIAESRRIDAPAHVIFEVLRDPKRHREFDGSTMVRDSDASPITATGDKFIVRMHNDEFGDYEMRSEVVEYVSNREIAWAPKRHDIVEDDWNHRWGWRLTPDGEATEVSAYFDCTRVPEDGQRILRGGEWSRPILRRSLENLENLVAS